MVLDPIHPKLEHLNGKLSTLFLWVLGLEVELSTVVALAVGTGALGFVGVRLLLPTERREREADFVPHTLPDTPVKLSTD